MHGEGFYTRLGREGAVGNGLTLTFKVDPKAREGTDFFRVGDYVVFLNRKALKILPSSLSLGPLEFYSMLDRIDHSDLGVARRLARNLPPKLREVDARRVKRS